MLYRCMQFFFSQHFSDFSCLTKVLKLWFIHIDTVKSFSRRFQSLSNGYERVDNNMTYIFIITYYIARLKINTCSKLYTINSFHFILCILRYIYNKKIVIS